MNKNIKILSIIIITFLLLFSTSFLLDIEIINKSITRSVLTILLMAVEFTIGFLLLKQIVLNE